MSYLDKFKRASYAQNTIVVNFIDPETGEKVLDENGNAVYIECRSAQSKEYINQINQQINIESKKKNKQVDIESMQRNNCRAVAAVTVGCNFDTVSFNHVDDLDPKQKDQAMKQVREFLFDVYPVFTETLIEKLNDDTLFMTKQKNDSSNTQDTLAGVTEMKAPS